MVVFWSFPNEFSTQQVTITCNVLLSKRAANVALSRKMVSLAVLTSSSLMLSFESFVAVIVYSGGGNGSITRGHCTAMPRGKD